MKILMLNYEFPPLGGGGGIAMSKIARELAKKHNVDVLTSGYRNLPNVEVIDNVSIYRVPVVMRKDLATATLVSMVSFVPSSIWKGIQLCNINHYDVINTHFAIPSGPAGLILSKLFKTAHVLSIHGGDIYDPSKKLSPHTSLILRKTVRTIIDNSSAVVAQSCNTRANAKLYYKTAKDICIIPLGFEKPLFKRVERKNLGMKEDTCYLISIGRLVKRKGYEYLIHALKDLDDNSKLLIIGDGPLEINLKKLSKDLSVQEKIEFLGFVSEEKKFQYLSLSDVYVLSSLHEGYGIVLQEAMFCDLPIVSTNNGGQTDFLKDGINALLVPIEDSKALSNAIKNVKNDENLREKMRQNNRRDIMHCDIEKIAREYEKVFEAQVS